MSPDTFDLTRFLLAQADGMFEQAVQELRAGRKKSHWIWFIFPQIAGLGKSPMSVRYAISGIEEARSYLGHPVLGERLRQAAAALLDCGNADADEVLGYIDAIKVRSSMTLFRAADPEESLFQEVLDKLYNGRPDNATLKILAEGARADAS